MGSTADHEWDALVCANEDPTGDKAEFYRRAVAGFERQPIADADLVLPTLAERSLDEIVAAVYARRVHPAA